MVDTISITITIFVALLSLVPIVPSYGGTNPCQAFCGNLKIDYPFGLQPGCGHLGFRELLFCINNVLMFHISSGSYRVLGIDYAYQTLLLHDAHMSTCHSIVLGGRGNGFVVEHWRAPYLNPTSDNVFMLIGCKSDSSLFQIDHGKRTPCRNVSGMSCEAYYRCPGWDMIRPKQYGLVYGPGPLECCALSFEDIKGVNISQLGCQGYSSAYSLAPLKRAGADEWSYGIEVKYSLQGNAGFCQACEATGGSCGHDVDGKNDLCLCGDRNSTRTCDFDEVPSKSHRRTWSPIVALGGFIISTTIIWRHLYEG